MATRTTTAVASPVIAGRKSNVLRRVRRGSVFFGMSLFTAAAGNAYAITITTSRSFVVVYYYTSRVYCCCCCCCCVLVVSACVPTILILLLWRRPSTGSVGGGGGVAGGSVPTRDRDGGDDDDVIAAAWVRRERCVRTATLGYAARSRVPNAARETTAGGEAKWNATHKKRARAPKR